MIDQFTVGNDHPARTPIQEGIEQDVTGHQNNLGTLMLVIFVATGALCEADQPQEAFDQANQPPKQTFLRIQKDGLPNAIRVRPNLISGGQPTQANGFRSLADLGIKTIISVDGICPDLKSAKKFGMRYIHLPLGYRGISVEKARILGHVLLKLDGPIYIHCHHGKHRSPAATAVACVTAGLMSNNAAVTLLEVAGTSPNYRGLFGAVQDARPVVTSKLRQLDPVLPEQANVGPVVEIMVQMDEDMTQLGSILNGLDQQLPKNAISPLAEHATLLNDNINEMLRRPESSEVHAAFRASLITSHTASEKLQWLLERSSHKALGPQQTKRASRLFDLISKQCHECHRKFRHNRP